MTSAPTLELEYDGANGEKAAVAPDGKNYIQKTGTKQLQSVTFTISDGKLAGRLPGGADFYVDSRAPDGSLDGNEWVHMVEVACRIQPAVPHSHARAHRGHDLDACPEEGGREAEMLPMIDGNLNEWGALAATQLNAGRLPQLPVGRNAGAGRSQCGVARGLVGRYALFAARVEDDVFVGGNSTQIWGDDVIELGIYSRRAGRRICSRWRWRPANG